MKTSTGGVSRRELQSYIFPPMFSSLRQGYLTNRWGENDLWTVDNPSLRLVAGMQDQDITSAQILLQTSRTEHCVAATPEKHAVGCCDSPADLDHLAKLLKAFRATQLSPPMSRNKSCFQLRSIVAHLFTHFLVEQILLTHMMHQRKSIHVSSLLSFHPWFLQNETRRQWNSGAFNGI